MKINFNDKSIVFGGASYRRKVCIQKSVTITTVAPANPDGEEDADLGIGIVVVEANVVGAPVGSDVGFVVGITVEASVGLAVVGAAVRFAVTTVGATVGAFVGTAAQTRLSALHSLEAHKTGFWSSQGTPPEKPSIETGNSPLSKSACTRAS